MSAYSLPGRDQPTDPLRRLADPEECRTCSEPWHARRVTGNQRVFSISGTGPKTDPDGGGLARSQQSTHLEMAHKQCGASQYASQLALNHLGRSQVAPVIDNERLFRI